MDPELIWQTLKDHWWWIHPLLAGLSVGGSLGIWAYRELWYGLSTFFSSPVETHSPFWALVQWLASLLMLTRSAVTVALILTWPTVLREYTPEGKRWIAVGIGIAVWALLRLFFAFGRVRNPVVRPNFLLHPFRWAYHRSVQTPDSLLTTWVDVILGAVLHIGLFLIWYEYRVQGSPGGWWRTAAIGGSVGLILILTSITVLVHPTPNTHRSESSSTKDDNGNTTT